MGRHGGEQPEGSDLSTWYWREMRDVLDDETIVLKTSWYWSDSHATGETEISPDHPDFGLWKWIMAEGHRFKKIIGDDDLDAIRAEYNQTRPEERGSDDRMTDPNPYTAPRSPIADFRHPPTDATPGDEHSPTGAVERMLLPVGRPGSAIAAGYLGLFSLLPFVGIFAIIVGVVALRTLGRKPYLSGRGRAVFGLVMGSVTTLIYLIPVVMILIDAIDIAQGRRPRF